MPIVAIENPEIMTVSFRQTRNDKDYGSCLWARLKMYEDRDEELPRYIPYEERRKVYSKALATWGDRAQMIVAIEELSECQKEICKILRGGENFPHLAEEIADATIMLEQLRLIFNINDDVNECMDAKIRRLEERLNGGNK